MTFRTVLALGLGVSLGQAAATDYSLRVDAGEHNRRNTPVTFPLPALGQAEWQLTGPGGLIYTLYDLGMKVGHSVRNIQDAIHIELPLSHVLPQPTAEFLIRQLELSASQVACRGEIEILLVIPGALIAQECGLDGLEKCHGQRCLFVQHE